MKGRVANYPGGDVIRKLVIFIILLFSFSILNLYADTTTDKYFKEVKSYMGGATAQSQESAVKQNRSYGLNAFTYIRFILVLSAVVFTIYLLSLILKRYLKKRGMIGEPSNVLLSQTIGNGKFLQVVFVAGKYLVLGVTNDNISIITEVTDPKEIDRLEIISNTRKAEEGDDFIDISSRFLKNFFTKKEPEKEFNYENDSINFYEEQKKRAARLKDDDK